MRLKRKRKKVTSTCLATVTLENPFHPGRVLTYTCAKPFLHEGEHASSLDPEQITYHWEEEDPIRREREACAQIADTYRSTAAGRSIAALIRSRVGP